jgi:hypothetical protein
MVKYFFCFLIIFLSAGIQQLRPQTVNGPVETSQSGSRYLYQPVSDSSYSTTGVLREVPEKEFKKYSENGDYAYANDPEYWKKRVAPKPDFFSEILNGRPLRWIIFLLLTAVLFFGVYQLARENNFRWFSRKSKQSILGSEETIPDEDPDFEKTILKYHGEANYRMAIRFMYLRLIQTTRKSGRIRFANTSTNTQIGQAFVNHPQAAEFRYLARAYEYIFYGDFIPSREVYEMLRNRFETFQHTI